MIIDNSITFSNHLLTKSITAATIKDITIVNTEIRAVKFIFCEFFNIDFTKVRFIGCEFVECMFINSRLSLNKIECTQIKNVEVKASGMLDNNLFIGSRIEQMFISDSIIQRDNTYTACVIKNSPTIKSGETVKDKCQHLNTIESVGFTKVYIDCKDCGIKLN